MKTKFILGIAFTAISSFSFSQTFDQEQLANTQARINRESKDKIVHKQIEGSQYADSESFRLKSPDSKEIEIAKYNAFNDKIEVLSGATLRELVPEKNVILSSVDLKKNYIYTDYTNRKNEPTTGYLNIISNNSKVLLLKKEQVVLVPESPAKNPYDTARSAYYKTAKPEYFIQLEKNGAIIPFPKSKKEVGKIISGKEKEINSFMKENKTSLNEEASIIKLVSFLNSIS